MANSDYEKRGSGSITPSASLSIEITARDTVIAIKDYFANDGTQPSPGQGIMVNGEIMRIVSVALPKITVSRGCADTIPAGRHVYGSKVWFLTQYGRDTREYMASETIGVKVLMKSSSGEMDVQNSPPNKLQFNHRFARPYPPGNVTLNAQPFYVRGTMNNDLPTLLIAWSHRDRITQGDTLQGHEVGDIGPEAGTTYVLRLYDQADNLVREIVDITTPAFSYPILNAVEDLGLVPGVDADVPAYFTLQSVRQGFESWQHYRLDFVANAGDLETGWGVAWGYAWGN